MCFLDFLFGFGSCPPRFEKIKHGNCSRCLFRICPCNCHCYNKDKCMFQSCERKGCCEFNMCGKHNKKGRSMFGVSEMNSHCKPCSKRSIAYNDTSKIYQPAYCPLICPRNFGNYNRDFWETGFRQ